MPIIDGAAPMPTTDAAAGDGEPSVLPLSAHFPPFDENDPPSVLRGGDAGLSDLRRHGRDLVLTAAAAGARAPSEAYRGDEDGGDGPDESYAGPATGAATEGGAEEEEEEEREEEALLLRLPDAAASLTVQRQRPSSSPSSSFRDVPGEVYVTTRRILFVSRDRRSGGGGEPSTGDERGEADLSLRDDEQQKQHDLCIDAGCVALHAMSESDGADGAGGGGWHVYCQLNCGEEGEDDGAAPRGLDGPPAAPSDGDGDGEAGAAAEEEAGGGGGGPTEVFFAPARSSADGDEGGGGGGAARDKCQELFDALSKMASLNPIYDDDDYGGGGGGGFGGLMAMMAGGNGPGFAFADDGDGGGDGEEMMCRLGNGVGILGGAWDGVGPVVGGGGGGGAGGGGNDGEDGEEGGATDEEREAMLARLDGMLVVPEQYEIKSDEDNGGENGGQFDDASDEEDNVL